MKNTDCILHLVLCMLVFAAFSLADEPPIRGVVLGSRDLKTVDWAKLAHENGLNTIGADASFVKTEQGKKFLADCKQYGIQVEYHTHAMRSFLPRNLFEQDPSLFRMNKDGERVNDYNLCVHSEKALDTVAQNARRFAETTPSDNHRYYFWLDDGAPVCECPECSRYSESEQALLVENRMIQELRKFDPHAQLAHLAYHTTTAAPRKVKPAEGVFLQFAPFHRVWDKPLTDETAAGSISHKEYLQHLRDNLEVFPAETAVVLEYWLDVSLFSGWKYPAVKLPWNKAVCESDLKTYTNFGIKNFMSFAVMVDDEYLKNYDNDLQFLKEYGELLNNIVQPKRGVVLSVQDLETVDWPKLACENGINTIGTHVFPKQVAAFIDSEKGRQFLADCEKYGVKVEHQLHAIGELLPRELFAEDPTMFRMNENGQRVGDCNLCVHSQKALDKVAEKAVHYAKLLPATNHRYYYWIDDGMPMCKCPECAKYSDSEQALIVENRIIKELRKHDPEALLAHLAYHNTMSAPRRVKPEEGIFLQYAPIHRTWDKPIDESHLRQLKENLTVFPVETAEVLEYWLDVSLFSKWKKPAVKLPWNREVFESDLETYTSLGIRHITSFAVYIDDKYIETYKDLGFLKEYGDGLKNLPQKAVTKNPPERCTVITVEDGLIHLDGENTEPQWANAPCIGTFTNPWNSAVNPATRLSFLKDSQYLYFFFEAEDTDLMIESAFTKERDAEKEDRVELFFSKDKEMNEYFGLEMDPAGRVLSYAAQYYRKFRFDWEPPEGFAVAARIRPGGYSVEGAIPLGFLEALKNDDGSLYFGAYRAEFSKNEDGAIVENWLTWVDPQTASPDFHVPQSLGMMAFQTAMKKISVRRDRNLSQPGRSGQAAQR